MTAYMAGGLWNWSPKSVNDIYAFPLDAWPTLRYNEGMEDMMHPVPRMGKLLRVARRAMKKERGE